MQQSLAVYAENFTTTVPLYRDGNVSLNDEVLKRQS